MTPNWFVGFPIDLGSYRDRLEPAPRGVRLFARPDTHLTVAFFGAVTEAHARDAFAACPEPDLMPTDVTFTHVELLGPRHKPSAISLIGTGEGAAEVAACMGRVRGPLLVAAGARPDDRPPLPHVTVARVQRKATGEQRRAARSWALALPLPAEPVRVSELALYTWHPDRAERLFDVVARRPPAGAPPSTGGAITPR